MFDPPGKDTGHADAQARRLGPPPHPARLRELGRWRRRLGVRLGTAGRRRVRRRHPARARPRRELDRHGGGVRPRPLRGGGRAGAPGEGEAALRLHQVLAWSGHGSRDRVLPAGGVGAPGVRGEPAPPSRGRHRSLPDPLARARRRDRGGLGRRWPGSEKEGKVRWIGVSNFSVDAARAVPADRARSPRSSRPTPRSTPSTTRRWSATSCSFCRAQRHRRHRLLADAGRACSPAP